MGLEEELYAVVIGLKEMIDVVLILAILFLIVIILRIIEKELRVKLQLRKKDRNLFYRREIERLIESKENPEQLLDQTNELARNFFNEAFELPYNIEYSELIDDFRKTGKKECMNFCGLILELIYSGEEIKKEEVEILINMLKKIIWQNKIVSKEEKENLEETAEKERIKEKKKRKTKEIINNYKTKLNFMPKIKALWGKISKKSEEREKVDLTAPPATTSPIE